MNTEGDVPEEQHEEHDEKEGSDDQKEEEAEKEMKIEVKKSKEVTGIGRQEDGTD
jgi:hypothetical protein